MAKDRGWDYLNSSGDDFDYDENNDGSWGYDNEDGSGSYYGADGSWGYKNADGSASYYGADGSWGYKNADGSSSYYGEDGSWGYKNSDGSGSFFGSDNESEYYDSNDEDSDEDYSSGESTAEALGTLLGLGLAAFAIGKANRNKNNHYTDDDYDEDDEPFYDEDYIRRQQEQEELKREAEARRAEAEQAKKDKRKASLRRVWSAIAHKKMIDTNVKSSECIGRNYLEVIALFEKSGFNKIHTNIIEDLEYQECARENLVTEVTIGGNNYFEESSQARYDSDIIITLHKLRRVNPPIPFKTAKTMPGPEVINAFINAGFVSVENNAIKDLTFGWLKKDGKIDVIAIGDERKYRQETFYRIDTPVVVTYHTFKEKK